jgi:hypothetical protein
MPHPVASLDDGLVLAAVTERDGGNPGDATADLVLASLPLAKSIAARSGVRPLAPEDRRDVDQELVLVTFAVLRRLRVRADKDVRATWIAALHSGVLGWRSHRIRRAHRSPQPLGDHDPPDPRQETDLALGRLADVARVDLLLGVLPPREGKAVRALFGIGGTPRRTSQEVAREWGVSRQRVDKIKLEAMGRLRRVAGVSHANPSPK